MPRFFFSFTVALATAAAVVAASSSVLAQPAVSSTSAAAPSPKEPENIPELQTAMNLLSKGNVKDAVDLLHKIYLQHPKLPNEYVMLYRVFAQMNQGNAAKQSLDKAAFEYPSDPEPWVIFGEMALNESRLAESALDYAKAGDLLGKYTNPDRKPILEQQALSGMAAVAERREQWKEAQKRLEELLKSSPNNVVALQHLARVKFLQSLSKSPDEAKAQVEDVYRDLQKAKQIDLDNVANDPTHKTREQLLPPAAIIAQYYDMSERKIPWKESVNAKRMFDYALSHSKDDLNLRSVVTVWALENGEMDLAKEQAKQALRIEEEDKKLPPSKQKYPNSNAARMLNGFVDIWDKKFDKAQDYFEKVFLEAPNDFAVKNNLALALVEQEDQRKMNRALDLAYSNYQNNKDNSNALDAASTLSWVYFKLGKFDLASAAMDAVLKATNGQVNNPDTGTYLAHILYHNDNGHNGLKFKTKQILDQIIKSGKPFSMKPEAMKLYDLVKDEKAPETSTPTASTK